MKNLMRIICDLLEKGQDIALATILTSVGSTPRTAGTKMVVAADGRTFGTIGGGLVEARVIEAASDAIRAKKSFIKPFDLSGADLDKLDLICGGKLDVLVEFVPSSSEHICAFGNLLSNLEGRRKAFFATALGASGDEWGKLLHFLILDDGRIQGDFACPSSWSQSILENARNERHPVLFSLDDQRILVEPFLSHGTVFLFGAGHVAQQVVPLAQLVDFRTVVLDDRAEFANVARFPSADEVRALDSFEGALDGLEMDHQSFVVIVTRGHRHDKTCLEQALRTKAGYIGMIGSRRKRDTIYRTLLSEGFTESDLARVRSPIGLAIKAETPDEIAVSIVAELIKDRSERNRG
jgi:xanthine dehydrogenase accessory factor